MISEQTSSNNTFNEYTLKYFSSDINQIRTGKQNHFMFQWKRFVAGNTKVWLLLHLRRRRRRRRMKRRRMRSTILQQRRIFGQGSCQGKKHRPGNVMDQRELLTLDSLARENHWSKKWREPTVPSEAVQDESTWCLSTRYGYTGVLHNFPKHYIFPISIFINQPT